MIGLSLTAIGLRPLADCLEISARLRGPLDLGYLELAVGVVCDVDEEYDDLPLVLHDSCLWSRASRLRLDPLRPATWAPYERFVRDHDVLAVSVHAPARSRCSEVELVAALNDMEQALQRPVSVEVMPERHRWCSSPQTIVDHPLTLDVSHVLIWQRGDADAAVAVCTSILEACEVREIHVSHNDGRSDTHDLIPEDIWFEPLVHRWATEWLVTYESLPVAFRRYERLDTRRHRWMSVG